jgi:hypothetical protein
VAFSQNLRKLVVFVDMGAESAHFLKVATTNHTAHCNACPTVILVCEVTWNCILRTKELWVNISFLAQLKEGTLALANEIGDSKAGDKVKS